MNHDSPASGAHFGAGSAISAAVTLGAFMLADYPRALALWQRTPGIGLNESDTERAIARFLERNPGLSTIATVASAELAGAVLCGHDGRRGYLHHLAVAPAYRRRGIARSLIERCLTGLAGEGIPKCNVFVFRNNIDGAAFWLHDGWSRVPWEALQKPVEGGTVGCD
jgi:putative acetyltransferase